MKGGEGSKENKDEETRTRTGVEETRDKDKNKVQGIKEIEESREIKGIKRTREGVIRGAGEAIKEIQEMSLDMTKETRTRK